MARPDYATVLAALHARFATIPALVRLDANGDNQAILDYEPTTVQDTPLLYSLFERTEFDPDSVTPITYYTLHRLIFQWQDPMMAERELRPYVDSLPATINATKESRRLDLGPAMSRGIATVRSVQGGFITIAGALYRVLDFTSEVLTK